CPAGADGPFRVPAAAPQPAGHGPDTAEDLRLHAGHLHLHAGAVPGGPGDLLYLEQPADHGPAMGHPEARRTPALRKVAPWRNRPRVTMLTIRQSWPETALPVNAQSCWAPPASPRCRCMRMWRWPSPGAPMSASPAS